MVGKLVRDRFGEIGTVVEWHEYAGYCLIRLLGTGRIVRRYTSWVWLA
jgi:hypothetical protein